VGDHEAPVSWLQRWKDAEPVRLYLGTVAGAVIVLAVLAGWVTQQLAVGISGVVAAVLMLGVGWNPLRAAVYAPASVDTLLDQQHVVSYEHGAEDMLVREFGASSGKVTAELQKMTADTAPREQLRMCVYRDEDGRQCTLREHPRRLPHQLETTAAE